MLHSMTGFGQVAAEVEGVHYSIEIKSVNNRYCKVSLKFPDFCSTTEPEAEKLVRSRLGRGMITLAAKAKLPSKEAYRIDTELLSSYAEQLRILKTDADMTTRLELGTLLQLPGVCQFAPPEDVLEKTRTGLLKLIEEALRRLIEMRRREGQSIQEDLEAHCKHIRQCVSEIAERSPQVVTNYKDRLSQRVGELTSAAEVTVDQEALAREVALFAERCDIAEELSRLGAHLDHFQHVMDEADGPTGRKLDFIAQELLREANTIAAKANDTQINQTVVEIKATIDRLKEQVQNVE